MAVAVEEETRVASDTDELSRSLRAALQAQLDLPREQRDEAEMARIQASMTELRDARYAARKAVLDADPHIDPRRRELYLDRELWDTRRCAREMSIGAHRISELRGGRKTAAGVELPVKSGPHPGVFPDSDGPPMKVSFGIPSYGVEAGRVRQWAEQRGYHTLDLETGALVKTRARHGRPRHDRPLLSKIQEPGKPRKGKKTGE